MNITEVISKFNESLKPILPPWNHDTLTGRRFVKKGRGLIPKKGYQIPILSQSISPDKSSHCQLMYWVHMWATVLNNRSPVPILPRAPRFQSQTFKKNDNGAYASQSSQLSLQMEIHKKVEMGIILSSWHTLQQRISKE